MSNQESSRDIKNLIQQSTDTNTPSVDNHTEQHMSAPETPHEGFEASEPTAAERAQFDQDRTHVRNTHNNTSSESPQDKERRKGLRPLLAGALLATVVAGGGYYISRGNENDSASDAPAPTNDKVTSAPKTPNAKKTQTTNSTPHSSASPNVQEGAPSTKPGFLEHGVGDNSEANLINYEISWDPNRPLQEDLDSLSIGLAHYLTSAKTEPNTGGNSNPDAAYQETAASAAKGDAYLASVFGEGWQNGAGARFVEGLKQSRPLISGCFQEAEIVADGFPAQFSFSITTVPGGEIGDQAANVVIEQGGSLAQQYSNDSLAWNSQDMGLNIIASRMSGNDDRAIFAIYPE